MKIYLYKLNKNELKATINGESANTAGLVPADEMNEEKIHKLPADYYSMTIKRYRNYPFHKKFFALIKIGHENSKYDMPFNVYRKYCIMKAGFFKVYSTKKGQLVEADSISFEKCSQEKFEHIFTAVFNFICEDLGSTRYEIEKELKKFMEKNAK